MTTGISPVKSTLLPQSPAESPKSFCKVSAKAINIINAIGLILLAAGIGCLVAGFQIPAIALAVSGIALLALGIILDANNEKTNPGPTKSTAAITPTFPTLPAAKPKKVTTLNPAITARIGSIPAVTTVGIDKIKLEGRLLGTMTGQGVGDAIGLLTEFQTKADAIARIGGKPIEFTNPAYNEYPGFQFSPGAFTDDTEQACAIIRAIHQHQIHPDKSLEVLFAEQLDNWRWHGIDDYHGQYKSNEPDPISECRDVGNLTKAVIGPKGKNINFLTNPVNQAFQIWTKNKPASNGSVMRTSAVAAVYNEDLAEVVEKTILFASVTHADPRSISAAVALSVAIALFLQGHEDIEEVTNTSLDIAKLVLQDQLKTKAVYFGKPSEQTYNQFSNDLEAHIKGNWESLELGDEHKMGYAYKCVGAAFCALRRAKELGEQGKPEPFRAVIEEITAEGGDADTNAAAAGALLGAYLGNDAIPTSWEEGMNPHSLAVLEENKALVKALSASV